MYKALVTIVATVVVTTASAGQVGSLNTFTAGTPAKAAEVNQNFQDVATAVNNNDSRLGTVESQLNTRQTTVSGTCTVGSAIRAINADGSVVCESFRKSGTEVLAPQDFRTTSESFIASGNCRATSGDYISFIGTNTSCIVVARLRLPDTSTITSLGCRVRAGSLGEIYGGISRHSLLDETIKDFVAETAISVSNGGNQLIAPTAAGPYSVVDNSSYYYTVYVTFNGGANSLNTVNQELKLLNCSIGYTLP